MKPLPTLAISLAFILHPSAFLLAQGPLAPPGAPAPTMKTLAQIEPRTDLQATPAPPGVDGSNASYHFIITQPGSYYLSANLGVTRTNGIQINAEGVTLDLNGFQISRAGGSGGSGIEIPATAHRASVRNGSLKGFANGIVSLLATDYARGCGFRDLSVSGCTAYGILAGSGAVLESCRAHDNSGTAGIFAGPGSSLTNCTASGNTSNYGIYADTGSSLTHCSAYSNTSTAPRSAGIGTGSGVTVTGCSASGNISTAAASTPTTGMGFDVGSEGTIQNCAATGNEGGGINLNCYSVVRDNLCYANGFFGDGAGIHATSFRNRIEGNNVSNNDRGIDVDLSGNVIFKNTASGNTINYVIVAGNVFGAIVDRTSFLSAGVSGNSAAATAGTTDPLANFAY